MLSFVSRRHKCLLCLLAGLGISSPAWPADQIRLEELIVTASPLRQTINSMPHHVSVITAEDLQKSNAFSLADVLSREAGISLKSYTGNDKKTSIDMRGMGDTAVSNVLIMLDGVRLNETDLSGADFTSLPLAQIDRIEIIRGGGSVMYGDGAVGGVINIITKSVKSGTSKLNLEAAAGSYGMHDLRAYGRTSHGPLAAILNASQFHTDGFRTNSHLDSRNAALEFRLQSPEALPFLGAHFKIAHHEDTYGLPGPVDAATFASGSAGRRSSLRPFDTGRTNDDIYSLGLQLDFAQAGKFEALLTARNRNNDYILGFNPLLSTQEQEASVESRRTHINLKYSNTFASIVPTQSVPASIVIGLDKLSADYAAHDAAKSRPGTLKKAGDIASWAAYTQATLSPLQHLQFNAGTRIEQVDTRFEESRFDRVCQTISIPVFPFVIQGPCGPFQYLPTGNQSNQSRYNHAAELGAVWHIHPQLTSFLSWNRHFRTPNVDELALSSETLRPQQGSTWETGLRYQAAEAGEAALTLFSIHNRDEIYFGADPSSGLAINRNYEQDTRRQGIELEARARLGSYLIVRGNGTYLVPEFMGDGLSIPNVPRNTANASLEAQLVPGLRWQLFCRYVGSRFDGNDFDNQSFPKLPAYTVLDTALTWSSGNTDWIVGINNLTNQAYSTLGYSATYYPMPERNGFIRVRVKF